MSDDMLVHSFSEGSKHVKIYITPSSKVYYVVTVGYFTDGEWKNQVFTILDSEVGDLMCLLRHAILFPKKAYAQFYTDESKKAYAELDK